MAGDGSIWLARLCEQLTAIRRVAEHRGQQAALDSALTAFGADDDAGRLADTVDELLRTWGIARGLGEQRSPGGGVLPDLGGGHPVEEALVCPVGRCDRVVLEGGGTCDLFDTSLRLVRL
ncbi:hypothetical protein ACFVZH_00595 [Streptomyces sp. NPDC059534]|uniref:hypothetical protein n=1 Tax=Streptomyces sp. NPDC059534 TaxID=3346859 RepID=UPI00367944AB